jgi:hypothetical protein
MENSDLGKNTFVEAPLVRPLSFRLSSSYLHPLPPFFFIAPTETQGSCRPKKNYLYGHDFFGLVIARR